MSCIELLGMKKTSKELTAATSIPMILSILSQKESYGYEIIQTVRTFSEGELEWEDGMLYPILHKLEKKQLIQSEWRIAENGRKRKYYKITALGATQLKTEQDNWQMLDTILRKIWKTD